MINEISLENFKGFKCLNNLKIKPITILCGTNSSGKSSILQSILLLRQTFESQNPIQNLLLNGRFVHMGIFDNLIYQKNNSNTIKYSFDFKINPKMFFNPRFRHTNELLKYRIRELILDKTRNYVDKELILKFKVELEKDKISTPDFYITPILVKKFELDIIQKDEKEKDFNSSLYLFHKNDDLYEMKWNNILQRFRSENKNFLKGNCDIKATFSNLFPNLYFDIDESKAPKYDPSVVYFSQHLKDIVKSIFCTYNYIGPLREEPSRRYIYENEIVEIGNKGENAAYILLSEKDKQIKGHFFIDFENNTLKEELKPLKEAVKDWLDFMNINNFNTSLKNEIIYLEMNSSIYDQTNVNIADVGFGISQIFPIVLEGLRMPEYNTLLLEQPEIHLHPNLQMQLADFFIAMAKSGKRFIVETHSDHIINRLVRRILEDTSGKHENDIGIYFFKNNSDGVQFEEINIDKKRGIVNWPKDFFDQNATEQKFILEASLKNRMSKIIGGENERSF